MDNYSPFCPSLYSMEKKKEDAKCTGTEASSNAIKLYMASVLWRKKAKQRAHRH